MIHQGQVQAFENFEHQKAEEAFNKIKPTVRRLTSQGRWVAVKFYFDAPRATNLLSSVFKEESDINHFLWIIYTTGDTKQEALGEQPARMDVAPLYDDYEDPKEPLGTDRTGYVEDIRIFPPDLDPTPTMMGHPSFVGSYNPDQVDQASVSGNFEEMVENGMHRLVQFHAGTAAVPRSVVEMWHVDYDGRKTLYETEWVGGNDPSKGLSARFVKRDSGKVLYTITSFFNHLDTPFGNLLGESASGGSTVIPDEGPWTATIIWEQKDNSG